MLVSTVVWLRRGVAAAVPARHFATDAELQGDEGDEEAAAMTSAAGDAPSSEEESGDEEAARLADTAAALTISPELNAKYDLDNYDEDDMDSASILERDVTYMMALPEGTADPYMTQEDREDDEIEDITIRQSDLLLLTGVTEEDDFSHLDVHVYEEGDDNLYTHHDLMLSSFPLCLEWLGFHVRTGESAADGLAERAGGNLVAIGTFDPHIEVWDLDLMDAMEPLMVLGDSPEEANVVKRTKKSKKKKSKKKKRPERVQAGHTDAVMGLSWNALVPNLLASSSADATVIIWDLEERAPLHRLSHHKDKVQSVRWHPSKPSVLATTSYDKSVMVVDLQNEEMRVGFSLPADPEGLQWHPHDDNILIVSTEGGAVVFFDIRSQANEPTLLIQAHEGPVCGMAMNEVVPGLLATCSPDKTLKLWDISDPSSVRMLHTHESTEQLFCVAWSRDSPFLLSVGGKLTHRVINTTQYDLVARRYQRDGS